MTHVRVSTETKDRLEKYKQDKNIESIDKVINEIYKKGVVKRWPGR